VRRVYFGKYMFLKASVFEKYQRIINGE